MQMMLMTKHCLCINTLVLKHQSVNTKVFMYKQRCLAININYVFIKCYSKRTLNSVNISTCFCSAAEVELYYKGYTIKFRSNNRKQMFWNRQLKVLS